MDIWAQRLYYQSAKVPPLLSLLCLYPLSALFFYSSLPSYIRATASVVPSSTVTN